MPMLLTWLNSSLEPMSRLLRRREAPATKSVKKIAFFVSDLIATCSIRPRPPRRRSMPRRSMALKCSCSTASLIPRSWFRTSTKSWRRAWTRRRFTSGTPIRTKPGVLDALEKGIIMTSFFSPLGDTGIPVARSDEKGISFAMGAEMAKQWKAAHPDKPIVMVELGWPNHTPSEVRAYRSLCGRVSCRWIPPPPTSAARMPARATDRGQADHHRPHDHAPGEST